MRRIRSKSGFGKLVICALVGATILPTGPSLRSAEQSIDLDGNPVNGAESRVVTRVLQSYPVKIENVIFNNAIGKSFTFDWAGAGPGGFLSYITPGPDVGTKWEWTTISQVYSILSPIQFEATSRGIPVVGSQPGGVHGATGGAASFGVPGKSIYPTQVTVSSASLTSSLITFFSPEQTVASCSGSFAAGRSEFTITNDSGGTVTASVVQPDCCPEAQMTICDDGCQFYLTDPENCGGCGIQCAYDETCSAGTCEPICPPGQTLCGEACVDLQADPGNCGACGASCDPFYRCAAGTCEPDCPPGQTLCGEICVDLGTDPNHCGACGAACGALYVCAAGACEPNCPPGQTLCGETCVDLLTDEANCGACGTQCGALYLCASGACEPNCPPGQSICADACVDLQSDPLNCGACGVTCAADEFCGAGACQPICPGQTLCGGACVDLQSDPLNCGTCGQACGPNQICTGGGCVTCRAPQQTACGNQCVNIHTDPFNCGACGNVCDFSDCPSTGSGTCSQGSSCVCDPAPLAQSDPLLEFEPTPRRSTARGRPIIAQRATPAESPLRPAGRRELVRTRAVGTPTVAASTTGTRALSVVEAPVCDIAPIQQTIPPGGSATQCLGGALVGKEIFTIATIAQDGKPVAQGPCALIVPAPEVAVAPFLPSPVAVGVLDQSGDGLCQPGETCDLLVSVQNLGGSAFLNPVGTLTSPADGFNPLPVSFLVDVSPYPDFPAFAGAADCDTPPELDPQTNHVAYSLVLPPEQEPDIGRVFHLSLAGDSGAPTVADMPFVLGIGRSCNPATDIDGETYDGIQGLLSPVDAPLAPPGNPIHYSSGSFNQTNTIPLKLRLRCGSQVLGPEGIDPKPEIVSLVHESLGPQPLLNINGTNGANPDNPFFDCSTNQCEYQLRTRDLPIGVYVISVRMPDTRVFRAGLAIRP